MLDGTFDVVPSNFYQLPRFIAKTYGEWFPFLFCLVTNKTQGIYTKIWEIVVDIGTEVSFSIPEAPFLHVDFEMALRNAFQDFFPGGKIVNCLFHFSQTIIRKIQSLGLFN